MEILVISKDKKFTIKTRLIAIGKRKPNPFVDKAIELREINKLSVKDLASKLGYRENLISKIENGEAEFTKSVKNKYIDLFKLSEDFFEDKELENCLIVDSGNVCALYDTNEEAKYMKDLIDKYIIEQIEDNEDIIIIDLSKENFREKGNENED